jgi:hypothetical protein
MWTVENRARYDRSRLRYLSDLTDEEWALVEAQIPRAKRGSPMPIFSARIARSRFMRSLTAQPITRRECRSRITAR